ncbi:MAG: polyprenyl synthetase family protein [Lachnospira sp.]
MKNFNEQLSVEVDKINKILDRYLPKEEGMAARVIEAMNYSVHAGGKRVRPMFMLEVYKLCGGNNEQEVYPFMAALEFIHTYSLVHDDLPAMDNDDYRRGQLTTHKKFGEDFGILAGDGLLNYAYEIMLNASAECCDEVQRKRYVTAASVIAGKSGIYGMVGGQTVDVYLTDRKMNEEQLDYIFRLKTGALLEAAFMSGAILAGCDEAKVEQLRECGLLIGFAFQIKDDILDVTGTAEILGKPVLSDEKNNKTTYVTLYGIEKANADVEEMSKKAESRLNEIGNNEFLLELVNQLIYRNK